jgi:hypothetical protein
MKICRGPFNVNCTTCKDPQLVLFEMVKSLELQKVSYKKVRNCLLYLITIFRLVHMG